MKTLSILCFVSSLAFGCASVAPHGNVLVNAAAAKAVVIGPAAIHAYAAFSGGSVYAAPAVSGGDSDCQAHAPATTSSGLRAEHVVSFTVEAGQVACVQASGPRTVEVLWHARREQASAAPTPLIVANNL